MAAKKKVNDPHKSQAKAASKSTVSGSRKGTAPARNDDPAARKMAATDALAGAFPFNENKPAEYGEASRETPEGAHVPPKDVTVTGSTLTEPASSTKVGAGDPSVIVGENPTVLPLDRVRVDATGQGLTTNQGVPVADNQHSLKAGLRGPTLMEDFILREKITHFDHERIPERVVHARGSGAHGYFEC